MSSAAKKITDFSIWDSVVNDRIIQLEDLEEKYRSRGRKMEALAGVKGEIICLSRLLSTTY